MLVAGGVLAVMGLILANGYFVAAEFGFVAARRSHLEERAARDGSRQAHRALDVQRRLSFMLSGAQLGITVTSLIVGFLAESTLGAALRPAVELVGVPDAAVGGLAFGLAFALATGAQMVLGELGPKNLAIAVPERVALSLATTMRAFLALTGPLIRLFDSSANRLLRAVGIEPVEELPAGASPEELGIIIEESGRHGALSAAQATLLGRMLHFDVLRTVDAMIPRPEVVSVHADATCEDLRRLALDSGLSRFPVVGEGLDDVLGLAQAKDVFRVDVDERAGTPVCAIMGPALAVPETAALRPLLGQMRRAQTQLAVVVDEHGGTAGIVSLEDLVEEFVGEIRDEHDPDEPAVQALPDGSFRVPGGWRIDEVERDTGHRLPEGDYETVGGLVMAGLGRMPRADDELRVDGAHLRVEVMQGLAVGRVRLRFDGGGEAP
ncbi:MAG: hemolysin family protein [Actinomycetota bacterium]|nr:hemolysin family protein [Actinomycetota bacterium]